METSDKRDTGVRRVRSTYVRGSVRVLERSQVLRRTTEGRVALVPMFALTFIVDCYGLVIKCSFERLLTKISNFS